MFDFVISIWSEENFFYPEKGSDCIYVGEKDRFLFDSRSHKTDKVRISFVGKKSKKYFSSIRFSLYLV